MHILTTFSFNLLICALTTCFTVYLIYKIIGYGAVSPPGDVSGCYAIRLVCAFVAFTGVLFGSTTA